MATKIRNWFLEPCENITGVGLEHSAKELSEMLLEQGRSRQRIQFQKSVD